MLALNRIQRKVLSPVRGEIFTKAVRSYHDNIIDHYENPRNVGSLDKKKKHVGTGELYVFTIPFLFYFVNIICMCQVWLALLLAGM